ncbi:hypothetical protein [Laceyella putida]|uniref:YknX-like C-terminal permuted SH3-like domain-containing protein n=1 Tax=Laceyella putida TaxID=110101 RepID=A0ABW2RP55_9BACL
MDIVTSNAEAMSLPATAVVEREEQQVVYVVREGKAVEKAVRVGKRNEQWVEILSGLLASDQVVVNPSKGLVNGMDVNVQ